LVKVLNLIEYMYLEDFLYFADQMFYLQYIIPLYMFWYSKYCNSFRII